MPSVPQQRVRIQFCTLLLFLGFYLHSQRYEFNGMRLTCKHVKQPLYRIMKAVWKHVDQCKDPNCIYQPCLLARKVVRHWQRCNDDSCPLCKPFLDLGHGLQ